MIGSRAVVIGGSIAGLLAARVLTDHFEKVTLVERDYFPEGVENRRGVPQGHHLHALLTKGQELISQLFPDIIPTLTERGAVVVDLAADTRWHHFGGYKIRFQSGVTVPFMSRPFIEHEIRQRVLSLSNFDYIDGHHAEELVATKDNSRVTGVKIRSPNSYKAETVLIADLIVDATGRGSQSPRWLESLGYTRPREEQVRIDLGYTSRIYERRPGDLEGAKGIYLLPTPPLGKRFGAVLPIEGDRWIVTLGGWLNDHAPADEQNFLEFARNLPTPDIYDVIRKIQPLTNFAVYKFQSNLRRRYEKMPRFPNGYIVVGDAICSFNPVYGQGMTVSAMEAEALNQSLKEQQSKGNMHGLPQRYFGRVKNIINAPWLLTVGEDFHYPEVVGAKPLGTGLLNRYADMIHRMSQHDPEVYKTFLYVMNLMQPPSVMFSPRIISRVIGL